MDEAPVIEVQNLTVRFPGPRGLAGLKSDPVTAVDNISFAVQRRETLGLVGESGRMQIVFQDPYSSLNPRPRVADIIRAPLDIHKLGTPAERRDRVKLLMAASGCGPTRPTITRTNFPAANASGSALRARWRHRRNW